MAGVGLGLGWGFGLCFLYLRNVQGRLWNHKRVYRIYRELELNLRIKPGRRLQREKPDILAVPVAPNVSWSMDFKADRLGDGRAFRLLTVLDDFSLDRIMEWRGRPGSIRVDNGPEYVSGKLIAWAVKLSGTRAWRPEPGRSSALISRIL